MSPPPYFSNKTLPYLSILYSINVSRKNIRYTKHGANVHVLHAQPPIRIPGSAFQHAAANNGYSGMPVF